MTALPVPADSDPQSPRLDPSVWRRILNHVRLTHPTLNRVWFEQLEPRQLDNGAIRVACQTQAQADFLSRQGQQPFNAAAQAVTNRLSVVLFHCNHPQPKAKPDGDGRGHGPAGFIPPAPIYAPGKADGDGTSDVPLSPDYSFSEYVTGPGNQLAHAAGVAVSERPGQVYNPLFVHGNVGLGKTHLLQAICQRLLERRPDLHILYLSCDALINQFVACVESGDMAGFRHRYRNADVLVIDDIHFLKGRERTQEEFFHTFNTLYQTGRQIILSADAPPNEVPELEERLVSRFNWGLVVPIERPDYDTRVAILRKKARARGVEIDPAVIDYIAGRIDSNTRELEGAVTKVLGLSSLSNGIGADGLPREPQPITLELAMKALGDTGKPEEPRRVTVDDIDEAVGRYFGVKKAELHGKKRNRSIAFPRQVCMYLARRHTRYSLEEVGAYLGGRDHTTVLHGVRTVTAQMELDPDVARQVAAVEQQLGRGSGG